MVDRFKVDFISRASNKNFGTLYAFKELYTRIEEDIDGKVIELKFNPLYFQVYTILNTLKTWKGIRQNGIVHFTSQDLTYPLNFIKCNKVIITCHDIIPIIFNDNLSRYISIKGLKNADLIIAVSEWTKKDTESLLGISPDRIKVIPNGVDREIYRPIENYSHSNFLDHFIQSQKRIILYVGSDEPRKNLKTLIESIFLLKKKFNDFILVITGNLHYDNGEEIMKLVAQLDLQNYVVNMGYVNQKELVALYNTADLFVYPSLYEGFGLPPLEAMACGAPVITSNTTSLPEIVGDAGIMVNPYDIDSLAKSMFEVLTNDGLREDMQKRGLERAKLFSWDRTAKSTLKIYEEVLSG